MQLLIISDTHGKTKRLIKLLRQYSTTVQAVLHAGDHDYDLLQYDREFDIPFYTVAGNCEDDSLSQRERVLVLDGRRIFMTHGNLYGLSMSVEKLAARAQQCHAAICVYGHTHRSSVFSMGDVLFMNPGSLTSPRDNKPPSYGLLRINDEDGTLYGEIKHI